MKSEFPNNDQRLAVCNLQWKKKKRSKDKNMKTKTERRTIQITDLRTIRADGEKPKITGYAAVFNSLSEDLGGFREKIAPLAFKGAIKEGETRMLWNHNSDLVLGRQSAGTLTLKEDKHGLKIENVPPDTQLGRDAMVSIGRGDVTEMSFGFRVEKDEWEEKKSGETIRTILKIQSLLDVSPVTYAAYQNTEVALRSLEDWKETNKQEDTETENLEDSKDNDNLDDKEDRDLENTENIDNNSVEDSNDSENDNNENDNNENRESEQNNDESNPDAATSESEQDGTDNATIESVNLKTIGLKLKTNQQIIDNE